MFLKVLEFLDDSVPEVRAAAVYAIGCLVRNRSENNEHATIVCFFPDLSIDLMM